MGRNDGNQYALRINEKRSKKFERRATRINCGAVSPRRATGLQLKSGDRIETLLRGTNKDDVCRGFHVTLLAPFLKTKRAVKTKKCL